MMQTDQDMSIQMDSNPNEELGWIVPSCHTPSHSDIPLSYWEEVDDRFFHCVDVDRCRDVYQVSKQPLKLRHKKGTIIEGETIHEKMMVLFRQEVSEAEVSSANEKNRHSMQFQQESTSVVRPPLKMSDDANSVQPTRIVVLKPKRQRESGSLYSSQLDSPRMFGEELFGYVEDDDDGRRELVETSNMGAGISTLSRHSWDYLSRFGVRYSPSGFSRASYSGEREAKKRLYERWALISSSDANYRESRHSRRSSSTLGEMLSLSVVKKKVTKAKGKLGEHKNSNPKLRNERRADRDAKGSPRKQKRSKSLPTSSAPSVTKLKKDSLLRKSNHGALREAPSIRSSLKEKITSLFFSKKKKRTNKDKALPSGKKDGFSRERNKQVPLHRHSSSSLQDHSFIGSLATVIGKKDAGFRQVGLSPKRLSTSPSPISILDEQFEEDELLTAEAITLQYEPIDQLEKPPLIESLTIQGSEGDKLADWTLFVGTLLFTVLQGDTLRSTFFSRWHSPESPLNPSLRDIDITFTDKERSVQKLVFDLVNALLLDIGCQSDSIGGLFKTNISSSTVFEEATSQTTAWLCGENGCFSDGSTLVTRELSGKGWGDKLSTEMGIFGKDVEKKLMDELVLETTFELVGRV